MRISGQLHTAENSSVGYPLYRQRGAPQKRLGLRGEMENNCPYQKLCSGRPTYYRRNGNCEIKL